MTETPRYATARKLITTYPVAAGLLIATIMAGTIVVIVVWFPSIADAWLRNDKLVRSIWCTLVLFAVCVYRLWHWRHRWEFWLTLSAFFVIHIFVVVLYSIYVHPLLLQEWVIFGILESFVIVFLLDWVFQRLNHQGKHERRSHVSDQ